MPGSHMVETCLDVEVFSRNTNTDVNGNAWLKTTEKQQIEGLKEWLVLIAAEPPHVFYANK